MFCQLLYLRRCIPGRIRHALNELPDTLDDTYAHTLGEIDKQNWKFAHRLFQCVAAASRPLHVNELAEFLAFDFEAGSTPTYLADWRLEDPIHTVLSICSSLLAVVRQDDGSPVVHFAHFSVKEYLTSARLAEAKDTISHFHVSMTAAHTIIAQACLGVLLHLDEGVTKDSLEKFPLAVYAAQNWVEHSRFESVSSNVKDGIERLFDPSRGHHSVWAWIYELGRPGSHEQSERPKKDWGTPLHYAAYWGMRDVAKFLIVEHSQDVNAHGFGEDNTPLHTASRGGHADVAQLLIEHGADVNARNGNNRTPLFLASIGDHVEVARVLLKHNADTEAPSVYKTGPLKWAATEGYVEFARVLLENGADVNALDNYHQTPLYRAQGEEVARLLLKHGAEPNAPDNRGQTPLHWLSYLGLGEAARVLLEHGVDPNARRSYNVTPLHLASSASKGDVIRLLLEYGADIHAREDDGLTPFMIATEEGYHDIMQLLLEHGAEDHRSAEAVGRDTGGRTRGLCGDCEQLP